MFSSTGRRSTEPDGRVAVGGTVVEGNKRPHRRKCVSRARACVCVCAREREDGKIRQPMDGRTDDDDNNSVDNAHTRYIRSAGYKNSLLNATALIGRAQGRKGRRRRGNGTTSRGRRRTRCCVRTLAGDTARGRCEQITGIRSADR